MRTSDRLVTCDKKDLPFQGPFQGAATTTAGTGAGTYAEVTAAGNGTATERAAGSQIATAHARQQQQQQQQSRQLQQPPTCETTMEGADAEATEVAATARNNTRTGNAASQAAATWHT